MTESAETSTVGEFDIQSILSQPDREPGPLGPLVRQQAAVLAFARRTNVQPALSILMQDAAALVAEVLRADLSGVAQVVGGGNTLSLQITGSDAEGRPLDPINRKSNMEPKGSLAGYTLSVARSVVSLDLAAEKRFSDLFLRKLGVVGAVSIPLYIGPEAYGTLGIYSKQKRKYSEDDAGFAETIAHLLTSSLARVKAEEALEEHREFASKVLDSVDTVILTLDIHGNLIDMNRAARQVTQFSLEEVRDKPFWNVMIAPEEFNLIRGIIWSFSGDEGACQFESYLLTKDGSRKRVSWSLTMMCDEKRRNKSLLLTGTDRTEQQEMEAELRKTREIAQKATRALEKSQAAGGRNDVGDESTSNDAVEDESAPRRDGGKTRRPAHAIKPKSGEELRTSPRQVFNYRQLIAPMYNRRFPSREQFFEVECKDISAGGIAFRLPERPDFDTLVVLLGKPPTESHFVAKVVRVAEEEHWGRVMFLIGCRFTGRVSI
jgi:PAS domain S-box-containing protein